MLQVIAQSLPSITLSLIFLNLPAQSKVRISFWLSLITLLHLLVFFYFFLCPWLPLSSLLWIMATSCSSQIRHLALFFFAFFLTPLLSKRSSWVLFLLFLCPISSDLLTPGCASLPEVGKHILTSPFHSFCPFLSKKQLFIFQPFRLLCFDEFFLLCSIALRLPLNLSSSPSSQSTFHHHLRRHWCSLLVGGVELINCHVKGREWKESLSAHHLTNPKI